MDEYIEREAAIARIKKYATDVYGVDLDSTEQYSADKFTNIFCDGLWSAKELINNITAADVAPVVHGRWINAYPDIEPNPLFMYGICSNCGFEQGLSDKLNYCPNCGAKMDGGDSDETD